MPNETPNTPSDTLQRLSTGELTAEQIREIGVTRIRDLRGQVEALARNPQNMQQMERLRAMLATRMRVVRLAANVTAQTSEASRKNELELVHAALDELNQELITRGVIPEYFGGNPAGRVLGHLETLGDRSIQNLRAQPTWMSVVMSVGIAGVVAYAWSRVRSGSTAVLAAGATAVGVTVGYLGIPWVRDLFNSFADRLRARLPEKMDQELKKLNEELQKGEKQTNQNYQQFTKFRGTSSEGELGLAIANTREAIRLERLLLTEANITRFASTPLRQQQLRARLERLAAMTKELDAADRRNVPPRTTEPGTKTNVQTEVKQKNDKVNAGPQPQVKTDVQGQQNTKVIPPRSERGPVGEADRKDVENEKAKVDAALKKKLEEGAKRTPPPGPQPGPNGQPTQDIDPVTGLPRVVPPVQPTQMPQQPRDNNGLPIPGVPQIDPNGNVILP